MGSFFSKKTQPTQSDAAQTHPGKEGNQKSQGVSSSDDDPVSSTEASHDLDPSVVPDEEDDPNESEAASLDSDQEEPPARSNDLSNDQDAGSVSSSVDSPPKRKATFDDRIVKKSKVTDATTNGSHDHNNDDELTDDKLLSSEECLPSDLFPFDEIQLPNGDGMTHKSAFPHVCQVHQEDILTS